MGSAHFLGNFRYPAPLHVIGSPRQIAHYSCFPGAINEYKYQSCEALRLYQPPGVPFSFDKAPDKSTFWQTCGYVDSLPQQGLEPVITSCQRAGRAVDLRRADVITRRGAVLKYVCSLAAVSSSGLLYLAYRWAWRTYTMFPLWTGGCTSSGRPLKCGGKSNTGSFH